MKVCIHILYQVESNINDSGLITDVHVNYFPGIPVNKSTRDCKCIILTRGGKKIDFLSLTKNVWKYQCITNVYIYIWITTAIIYRYINEVYNMDFIYIYIFKSYDMFWPSVNFSSVRDLRCWIISSSRKASLAKKVESMPSLWSAWPQLCCWKK